MPWTFWLMAIATLAIAGIPPFAGFFSKDEILAAAFARGAEQPVYYVFYGLGVIAALLTAFYMARLMAMTFLGENRTGEQERAHLHEAPWIMTGPLVVLGVLSAVGGALNLPAFVRRRIRRWSTGSSRSPPRPRRSSGSRLRTAATEYYLIGAAVLIGIVGLVAGWRATLARPIPTARRGAARPRIRPGAQPEVLHRRAVRRGRRAAARVALSRGALAAGWTRAWWMARR